MLETIRQVILTSLSLFFSSSPFLTTCFFGILPLAVEQKSEVERISARFSLPTSGFREVLAYPVKLMYMLCTRSIGSYCVDSFHSCHKTVDAQIGNEITVEWSKWLLDHPKHWTCWQSGISFFLASSFSCLYFYCHIRHLYIPAAPTTEKTFLFQQTSTECEKG